MQRKISAAWVVTASLSRLFLKQAINQRSQCWLSVLTILQVSSPHGLFFSLSCAEFLIVLKPSKEDQDLGLMSNDSQGPWMSSGTLLAKLENLDRTVYFQWRWKELEIYFGYFLSSICQSHHKSSVWYPKTGAPIQPVIITSRSRTFEEAVFSKLRLWKT